MLQRFFHLVAASTLLLCCLTAQAATDFSAETIFKAKNNQGETIYLLRYYEEGLWRVEEILQHPDGWQDLLSKKSYTTLSKAEQAQYQLQKKYPQLTLSRVQEEESSLQLQGGAIWPTTESWSWEWEKKYAEWLTQEMNPEFFQKYKIRTDCADVAFAARWIFARIHGLPAANHLSGSKALMTNMSLRAEWASLPTAKSWHEDRRFLAALNYLLSMSYTHSLMRDSYPVAINKDNFLPGIHYLNLHESSGHTQLVHRVFSTSDEVPFLIIQSTVPRVVRVLNEGLFWSWGDTKLTQAGLLRMLWPKVHKGNYTLEKPQNMPGYSLEQYDPAFIREKDRPFSLEVYLRLNPTLSFTKLFKNSMQAIFDALQLRLAVVEEGYRYCSAHSCPEGSAAYEEWSTPSRDDKILKMMRQVDSLRWLPLPPKDREEILAFYKEEEAKTYLNFNQKEYSYKALYFIWAAEIFSSNPNAEPALRWALSPAPFAERIVSRLEGFYQQRQKKIEMQTEYAIKSMFSVGLAYCRIFDGEDCREFQSELQKKVKIMNQERPLQKWLELGLWMNSDPAQSRENQWGALREKSKFQLLQNVAAIQVTKAGFGLIEEGQKKRIGLMGKEGLQEINLPASFQWQHLDQASSVAYAFSEGQVLRRDLVAGTEKVFSAPVQDVTEVWGGELDQLVAFSPTHIWSLSFTAQGIQVHWEKEASAFGTHREGARIYSDGQGSWKILNLKTGLETPLAKAAVGASILFEDESFYGLADFTAKTGLMIEKLTGQSYVFNELSGVLVWNSDRSKVVTFQTQGDSAGNAMLLTLGKKFQVIKSELLGSLRQVSRGFLLVLKAGEKSAKLHYFEGEELRTAPLLSDEVAYLSIDAPLVQVSLSKDKRRLRSLDAKRIFYEGPLVHLSAGQQNQPHWLIQRDPESWQKEFKIVSSEAPKAPAMMTGIYERAFSNGFGNFDSFLKANIDRGVIIDSQGAKFWVEFP